MSDDKADIESDISAVMVRKETVALMEPLLIAEGSRYRGELTDLTVEVAARSAGFRRSLPDGVRTALVDKGVLTSKSARAPLRLAFPAALASRWLPGLFPERTQ